MSQFNSIISQKNSSTEGASGSITDDLLDGFEPNSDALIFAGEDLLRRSLTSIPSTETTHPTPMIALQASRPFIPRRLRTYSVSLSHREEILSSWNRVSAEEKTGENLRAVSSVGE